MIRLIRLILTEVHELVKGGTRAHALWCRGPSLNPAQMEISPANSPFFHALAPLQGMASLVFDCVDVPVPKFRNLQVG